VSDYLGRTINVNVGRNNFDQLRYEYFRDPAVAIAAFRANTIDWRTENNARSWTTAYRFAAVQDKRVMLEEFPIRDVGIMQGFAFNTRRKKFQDPRVRLAFNYAFDFDRLNRQIFHGQYKRIDSYFEGTELAATGLPAGRELELLQSVRDNVPAEVFTKAYSNPIFNTPDSARNNLRHAIGLLREAGYEVRDRQLVDANTNESYVVEFLTGDRSFERVILLYKASLDRLGMKVTVRTVDPAQYENRLRSWDFDIITSAWSTSLSPGEEQRSYWGSQAADLPGSLNLIGIKNPAVDAMIDQIVLAKSRAGLEAATAALDRVLLWNHYVVPQWLQSKVRTARWDRFGHPDLMPKYGRAAFPALCWWDAEKARQDRIVL
jgi:microcin C transport system substrate-binding protein